MTRWRAAVFSCGAVFSAPPARAGSGQEQQPGGDTEERVGLPSLHRLSPVLSSGEALIELLIVRRQRAHLVQMDHQSASSSPPR